MKTEQFPSSLASLMSETVFYEHHERRSYRMHALNDVRRLLRTYESCIWLCSLTVHFNTQSEIVYWFFFFGGGYS